jgi:hypothetical protein
MAIFMVFLLILIFLCLQLFGFQTTGNNPLTSGHVQILQSPLGPRRQDDVDITSNPVPDNHPESERIRLVHRLNAPQIKTSAPQASTAAILEGAPFPGG